MVTFKIRDLMVSVRPAGEVEQTANDDPVPLAVCPRQSCQVHGDGCPCSQPPDIAVLEQLELAVLKEQLAAAMQQIEQREEVLRRRAEQEARTPRTLAEVDTLERELSQALAELRARRAELEQAADTETEPQ